MHINKIVLILCCISLFYFPEISSVRAEIPDTVLKKKDAVLGIYIEDKSGNRIATGNGIIVDAEGIILTSSRLLSEWLGSDSLILFRQEGLIFYPLEDLIFFNKNTDVALLKIDGGGLPVLETDSTYTIHAGEDVIVVSRSPEHFLTTAQGTLTMARETNYAIKFSEMSPAAAIGSPVFAKNGKVMGILITSADHKDRESRVAPLTVLPRLLEDHRSKRKKVSLPDSHTSSQQEPRRSSLSPSQLNEIEKLKLLAVKHPLDARLFMNLGLKYFSAGMFEKATEAFLKTVGISPRNAGAHVRLGVSYGRLGYYRKAINSFKDAIRISPGNAEAYNNLGVAYCSLGMYEDGIEAYRQALKLRQDYAEAYANLAFAYGSLDRIAEEIKTYKQAIRYAPDLAMAHYNLGLAYGKSGNFDEAVSSFKNAVQIRRDDTKAFYNLGVSYGKLGLFDKEIDAYKQAVRFEPDYARAHYNLGLAYAAVNDRISALDEYRILKELDPDLAKELFDMVYK